MNSIIKTIDEQGRISDNAIYSLDPKRALIAYLEQAYSSYFVTDETEQQTEQQERTA